MTFTELLAETVATGLKAGVHPGQIVFDLERAKHSLLASMHREELARAVAAAGQAQVIVTEGGKS